jgi:calpactin-1 light chain
MRTMSLTWSILTLSSPQTLTPALQSQKDPAAVDKIMKDLDTNGDGQVDFEEFVSLVVGLSIACEQCYKMQLSTGGKKH